MCNLPSEIDVPVKVSEHKTRNCWKQCVCDYPVLLTLRFFWSKAVVLGVLIVLNLRSFWSKVVYLMVHDCFELEILHTWSSAFWHYWLSIVWILRNQIPISFWQLHFLFVLVLKPNKKLSWVLSFALVRCTKQQIPPWTQAIGSNPKRT